MSRTTTRNEARDVFTREGAPPAKPRRAIKRPPDPVLIHLKAPKRQCKRDLHLPSHADYLREVQQLAEDAKLERDIRAMAQELQESRRKPGGSGHPLVKPVNVFNVMLPENVDAVPPKVVDEAKGQRLQATVEAANKLDQITGGHKYLGDLPPDLDATLNDAQRATRNRRNRRHRAAAAAERERVKNMAVPENYMEAPIIVKRTAEEKKELLFVRKPALAYARVLRSLEKDSMLKLPPLRPNMANLREAIWGPQEFHIFDGSNRALGLNPWDKFRVPIYKRVLDLREEPLSIQFFRKEFQDFHDILGEVVKRHFGKLKLDQEFQSEKGLNVLEKLLGTVKLDSLIDAVYDNDGDFMTVACDPTRRSEVVQGVIVRILHARVWNSLLFGGTPKQAEEVERVERRLATDRRLEGFARQKKRSAFIREELRRDRTENGLPLHFLEQIGYVTLEIFNLLSPLADQLRSYGPGRQPQPYQEMEADEYYSAVEYLNNSRQAQFIDIHSIVSMAAYLAICVRIHPTPIMVELRTPGMLYEKELELTVVNYDEYREQKVELGKAHLDRKDAEAREMLRDMEDAKRICGLEYDKVVKTIHDNTVTVEHTLLLDVFKDSKRPMPPSTADWRRMLEDTLEHPNATDEPLTRDQKTQGRWYLSYLRFMDLLKKTGLKKQDIKLMNHILRRAYVELYCGKFFADVASKYRRLNDRADRQPIIRTALWPSVKLYRPGDGKPGGEQNGMRSWNITKGEAACHLAKPLDQRRDTFDEQRLDEDKLKQDQLHAMHIATGMHLKAPKEANPDDDSSSDGSDSDDDDNENGKTKTGDSAAKSPFDEHLDAINSTYRYSVRYPRDPKPNTRPRFQQANFLEPQYYKDWNLTVSQRALRDRRHRWQDEKRLAKKNARTVEKAERAKRRAGAEERAKKLEEKLDAKLKEAERDAKEKEQKEKAKAAAKTPAAKQNPLKRLFPRGALLGEGWDKLTPEQQKRFTESRKAGKALAAQEELTVENLMEKLGLTREAAEETLADLQSLAEAKAKREKEGEDDAYELAQEQIDKQIYLQSEPLESTPEFLAARDQARALFYEFAVSDRDVRQEFLTAVNDVEDRRPDADAFWEKTLIDCLDPSFPEEKQELKLSTLEQRQAAQIYLLYMWFQDFWRTHGLMDPATLDGETVEVLREDYAQLYCHVLVSNPEIRKKLAEAADRGHRQQPERIWTEEEIAAAKGMAEAWYYHMLTEVKRDMFNTGRRDYKRVVLGIQHDLPIREDRQRLLLHGAFHEGHVPQLKPDETYFALEYLTYLLFKEMKKESGIELDDLVDLRIPQGPGTLVRVFGWMRPASKTELKEILSKDMIKPFQRDYYTYYLGRDLLPSILKEQEDEDSENPDGEESGNPNDADAENPVDAAAGTTNL